MEYADEIEGCFESVFREIGTSDETWNIQYSYYLNAIDIREVERWAKLLISEGMTKEKAFHHIEKYIEQRNNEIQKQQGR